MQTELGAVKIKPIKSNLRKESKVNRNDEKSSVDVSHNSTFSASWKYWFLKRSSRLDELLREYSKNGADNIVAQSVLKSRRQLKTKKPMG